MNPQDALMLDKKTHGEARIIAVFDQSKPMQRLASVWADVPKKIEALMDLKAQAPGDERECWEWLWGLIEYDETRWIRMALLPCNTHSKGLIQRMIDLHMVYPDGTLQPWVDRYVKLTALVPFRFLGGTPEKKGDKREPEKPQGDGVKVTEVGG